MNKKTLSRREFLALSAAVSAGAVLAACAPNQATTKVEPTAVSPTAIPPTATMRPQDKVTLIVGSWRQEDRVLWEDNIVPVFEAAYPTIRMLFQPTPNTYYAASLQTALEGGTAPDVFVEGPFDMSLPHWNKGYLTPLTDMKELDHFNNVAKSAWSTPDGKTVYAMPNNSVMHGFIYNMQIFDELGLKPPETIDEFFQVLEAIKKGGKYIPLAFGTSDAWTTSIIGFDNVGPVFWKGEEGRWDLIRGKRKMTDPIYTDAWKFMAAWAPYMPENYEAVTYTDGQELFNQGKAVIRVAGSWELSVFEPKAKFPMGIFKPPVKQKGDKYYVNDWIDSAWAVNAATKHPEEAKTLAQWFGGKEFAEIETNILTGVFTLSDYDINVKDPLAKAFLQWRKEAEMTLRLDAQYVSSGTPDLTSTLFNLSQQVMNLKITPEQAGVEAQKALDSWYKPPQA